MPINPLNALTDRWRKACLDILHWWMTYAIDRAGPGFYGEVNNLNLPGFSAPKGLVMHARILWSFATAYAYFREEALIETAYLAEQILEQYFHDTRYEGYYWKLHADYQIADSRKMLYGQAFVLYAYVALFQATHHPRWLSKACALFETIEQHCGPFVPYNEAFNESWQIPADSRLDVHEPQFAYSLNAQLHLMEAYTALYKVYQDTRLLQRLLQLGAFIQEKLYSSSHLILWVDRSLQPVSQAFSPGHEIETAWLLMDMLEHTQQTNEKIKRMAFRLGYQVRQHMHAHDGLMEPIVPAEKQWWAQAEAMTGFLRLYMLSHDKAFLQATAYMWRLIDRYFIDHTRGEWFWGVDEHNQILPHRYKAGFWKGPYHAVRALLQPSIVDKTNGG